MTITSAPLLRLSALSAIALTTAVVGLGAPSAEANTRATVYPTRTQHQLGSDWTFTVSGSDRNANAEVAAESAFNDPPRAGYQYVTVEVSGTKRTAGEGDLWWDVDYALRGRATATRYEQAYGVIPDDLSEADPVPQGGQVSGNLLFEVSKADIRDGVLLLRASVAADPPTAWFRTASAKDSPT